MNIEINTETKKLISIGDIYVDVDIRFVDRSMQNRSVEEQLVVDSLNSSLGALAYEVKQTVKDLVLDAVGNK